MFHFTWPGIYLGGDAIIAAPSDETARELLATKLDPQTMAQVECEGGVVPNPKMANLLYFDDGDY